MATLVIPMPAKAAIVALSSSLDLEATADAGGGLVTDTDTDSQIGTINPLSASVSALATFNRASVLSEAEANATWSSTSQGQVVFSNVGWETLNVSDGQATLFGGTDWTYTFIADGDGLFTLNYDISSSPDTTDDFGLNGFNFVWSGTGGDTFLDLNSSGTLTRPVTLGDTFSVNINNEASIGGGLGTSKASMDGTFTWNIETVPEPSSAVGLLAIGALGTGSILKQKLAKAKKSNKADG